MRKLKRLASVLLALVMCFGLTVTAFADDTYSITVTNPDSGYTYTAYQVFAGDYDATAGTFVTTGWGSAIDPSGNTDLSALYTALEAITVNGSTPFANIETDPGGPAIETARVLENYDNDSAVVQAFANVVASYVTGGTTSDSGTLKSGDYNYVISGLTSGYYLVKSTTVPDGGTYSSYMLEVVENEAVTIESKSDVPTFNKTIDDINDSTETASTVSDNDSADWDIGDDVPYTLTATLPTNYADYDTYKLVFHDIMDSGLSFNADSVVVYVTTSETTYTVKSTGYTIYTADTSDSYAATSTYTGHTTSDSSTFEIEITDTNSLEDTTGASIPVDATSIVTVKYTATLNSGAGTAEWNYAYLEFSNNPNWDGTGTEETGTTPEDEVVVINFKLTVDKTDKDGNALTGAGFTLYKYDKDADTSVYTDGYVPVGSEVGGSGTSISEFTWDGLDDGDYKLVETTVPSGYKTITDIYFTVTATHSETATSSTTTLATNYSQVLDSLTVSDSTFTPSASTGEITTTIANSKIGDLPSTGGIGTTIFYVVGGVLVAGAVVLLITRKRMKDGQ